MLASTQASGQLEDLPGPLECAPEADRVGNRVRELRSDDDEREGSKHEQGDANRQRDRDQANLPPRAPFFDAIRVVHRVDDGGHRRRTAPKRRQDAEREEAALIIARDLADLIGDDGQEFGRCELTK